MGLPTVAMSLLGLWMAPVQAAALLVVPSLATNVAQCRGPHLLPLAARLWPGWVAIAVVTVIAPGFGGLASVESARAWLGVVLIAYGVWGLWRPVLPDLAARGDGGCSAIAGAMTGVVTAHRRLRSAVGSPIYSQFGWEGKRWCKPWDYRSPSPRWPSRFEYRLRHRYGGQCSPRSPYA